MAGTSPDRHLARWTRRRCGRRLGLAERSSGVGGLYLPGSRGANVRTFLQVPFTKLTAAFRDTRFLAAVLVLNFAIVPLIVAALIAVITLPQPVLLGVLV
jgi:hypothetical protein